MDNWEIWKGVIFMGSLQWPSCCDLVLKLINFHLSVFGDTTWSDTAYYFWRAPPAAVVLSAGFIACPKEIIFPLEMWMDWLEKWFACSWFYRTHLPDNQMFFNCWSIAREKKLNVPITLCKETFVLLRNLPNNNY